MGTRISAVGALMLLSIAFAAACGGDEEASEDSAEDRATEGDAQQTDEETAQERAEAGKESKGSKKGKGKKGKARGQEATLEMNGDSRSEFSGSCTVGDEEMEVSGQVPESFTYELDGERLECEISKEGTEGDLEVAFTAGNNVNSVQRISGGTLKLVYENGRLSSSTSSGSGGSSSSSTQVLSSSQSSSSSSSVTSFP